MELFGANKCSKTWFGMEKPMYDFFLAQLFYLKQVKQFVTFNISKEKLL